MWQPLPTADLAVCSLDSDRLVTFHRLSYLAMGFHVMSLTIFFILLYGGIFVFVLWCINDIDDKYFNGNMGCLFWTLATLACIALLRSCT